MLKLPNRGIWLNDVYKYPFTNCDSVVKLTFFEPVSWLVGQVKIHNGDTGVKPTVPSNTQVVSHYQAELGFDYILLGNFQTDPTGKQILFI